MITAIKTDKVAAEITHSWSCSVSCMHILGYQHLVSTQSHVAVLFQLSLCNKDLDDIRRFIK